MAWLTAEQALVALKVRPQTLYANVSRGRIRAKPDPEDSRRSLYNDQDVKRLAGRHAGRRTVAAVAAETIGWGDPVLPSSISTVAEGRLLYRGHDAVELSNSATLEQIAGLLWEVQPVAFEFGGNPIEAPDLAEGPLPPALLTLAKRAGVDPPSRGRSRAVLIAEATELLDEIATSMLGRPAAGMPLHRRAALAWGAPHAEDIIRRAFVLLADHELNASTFATRVAVSTGTSLAASLMVGLATLAGPLHGGVWAGIRTLITAARQSGAAATVREYLTLGHQLSGFGHQLYPDGDPRAIALFAHFTPRQVFVDVRAQVEALTGEEPNVDFALSALTDAFALPPSAPFVIFALARSVGWIAHALEQIATGHLIRPRARYIGPPLASADRL